MSKLKSAEAKTHMSTQGHVKPKSLGTTWWGQRWIEALERSSRDVVARLGKGRAYARDGHVHGLKIFPGKVTATVTDDELDSYAVSLNLDVFDSNSWNQLLQAMSQQALFAAQLLNGEMPKDADRLFRSCGKGLFPANSHDIDADCGCDDWSSPCKHVAATHYVLGEALDHDPFLLFELRGRSKEQVLAGLNRLRAHSGNQDVGTAAVSSELVSATLPAVALNSLRPQDFESGATPLPVMSFNFDSAPVSGTLLRSLGKPSSWLVHESPQDLFGPALLHARQLAVELATGSGVLPVSRGTLPSGKSGSTAKAAQTRKPRAKRKGS
jgi:uncharacterized Zn finger protein